MGLTINNKQSHQKEVGMQTGEQEIRIVNAWQSYAIKGDRVSAEIVDQDVRRFMQETGETDYNAAMKTRRQQVQGIEADMAQDRVRANTRERHYAGVELLEIAQEYQKARPDLSDKEAFNLALVSKPLLAEQYT